MKRNGFTLIELLAVIVILAIIAVIAVPIVLNIIEDSKENATLRSAEFYLDAVETAIVSARLDGVILEGTYTINDNGNLTGNGLTEPLIIEMSGTKPTGGTVTIENGQVVPTGTTMKVGDYNVSYNNEKKTYVATKVNEENSNVLCTAVTTRVNALVYDISVAPPEDVRGYKPQEVGLITSESGAYTPGVAYTCDLGAGEEIFYVLEENGDNVTLILGKNLGDNISDSSALAKLKERTTGWTKLKENQITLPSAQQIAIAAGYQKWDDSSIELPTWLTSYTEYDGGSQGYWTSTQHEYMDCCNESGEPYVYTIMAVPVSVMTGDFNIAPFDYGYSVRPVITVLKSNLSS